jgi:hypothetical protein
MMADSTEQHLREQGHGLENQRGQHQLRVFGDDSGELVRFEQRGCVGDEHGHEGEAEIDRGPEY